MIKIVIVDDSRTARLALRQALEKDSELLIVGEASTGAETIQMIKRYKPDLVTLDVFLEKENGLDVAVSIMAEQPCPLIVITGVNPSDPQLIYKAMQRGVLEVLAKLPSPKSREYEKQRIELVRLIKSLASVPVVQRAVKNRARLRSLIKRLSVPPKIRHKEKRDKQRQPTDIRLNPKVLLIGASTGGPPLISTLLQALPKPFPLPIVIAQHISEGFAEGFTVWLSQVSGFSTVLLQESTLIVPGTVYVAPDNQHVRFSSIDYLVPVAVDKNDIIKPSIDLLFSSGAEHLGSAAIAVLLSGMGKDGSAGLKSLFNAGAFTIVQAPETCIVDSMPQAAIDLQAAESVLQPEDMGHNISYRLRV